LTPGPGETSRFGRRRFLAATGAGLGALAAGGALPAGADVAVTPDYRSWKAVRSAFPLDRRKVHFTSFLLSPHPKPVAQAIESLRRRIDDDPETFLFEHQAEQEDAVLRATAAYTGGEPDELAMTDSTTMGLGLVYGGLKLSPGDEILTSAHDFYSTHESLRLRARRSGSRVRKLTLYRRAELASTDEIVSAVRGAIGPRTRVLALTWVHSGTGVKLPVQQLADAVADANRGRRAEERVLFCLDGVHGFGNQDVALAKLGCDVFVSGCHKWLFGPRGTGVIWAKPAAWQRISATIPTFDTRGIVDWLQPSARLPVTDGARMTPGGFHSFEHRWALAAAFDFHAAIGRPRVARRTRELAGKLKEGLGELRSVTLRTPRSAELSAGIVCFDVKGMRASDAVRALRARRIVATVTPYAIEHVRLGPSIANSPEDVDEALRAIQDLR
jgi:isopenicillin-N epimerase